MNVTPPAVAAWLRGRSTPPDDLGPVLTEMVGKKQAAEILAAIPPRVPRRMGRPRKHPTT